VSDRFRVIAGVRWTQDDLSFRHLYNFSPIAGPGIRNQTGGGTALLSGSNSADNVSGRLGVQFEINNDFTTYLTYARGYKGPAYNVFFNMTANNAPVIDEETADSAELGLKSALFDGKMVVNAAAFYAKYDDFQANNFLFLNNTLITTLTNAGKVTTGGVEVDFLARPTDRFSISGGFSYNEARVDSLFVPPGQSPQYPIGIELPFAPKYKGSLVTEYRIPAGRFEVTPISSRSSRAAPTWSRRALLATRRWI
jgi:iron complex outermembrane receptor protein